MHMQPLFRCLLRYNLPFSKKRFLLTLRYMAAGDSGVGTFEGTARQFSYTTSGGRVKHFWETYLLEEMRSRTAINVGLMKTQHNDHTM